MNTNNRFVWLQQHVVLLTVMEHAEDLIMKKSKTPLIMPSNRLTSHSQTAPFAVPNCALCSTKLRPLQYQTAPSAVPNCALCSTKLRPLQYQTAPFAVPNCALCSTKLRPLQYQTAPFAVPNCALCSTKHLTVRSTQNCWVKSFLYRKFIGKNWNITRKW
jgi:hypothetical protein